MTALPTPPHDLSDHDRNGISGTLHTPAPAAVEHLKTLLARPQPSAHAEPTKRVYNGDRIAANIQRAAAAVNARRRYVLSDEQYADVMARREKRESWTSIAKEYGVVHTTLMNAVARYLAAAKKAQREAK